MCEKQVLLSDMGYAKLVAPEDAPSGSVEPNTPSFFCAVLSVCLRIIVVTVESL